MMQRFRRHAPWLAIWLLASLAGAWTVGQMRLGQLHEEFDTNARIAHRLLSQRAAQHEAVLSTLGLLRTGNEPARPEQRLPSVYPQILSVQRRSLEAVWPEAPLQAADAESRRLHRPVLSELNFAKGRYGLVLGAEPASYALVIDVRNMVPWNEWPLPPDASPVRMVLAYDGQTAVLQPGALQGDQPGGWHFSATKVLAAPSQPFDLVAHSCVGWDELPWAMMLSWSLFVAVLLLATRAVLRQRTDRRRAEELLRLGQVTRLNTLGELAAGMAHELNQPLTAMLANTQAAQRVLDEDPPDLLTAQVAMQQAVGQAQRASDVLNRMRHAVEQPDLGAQLQDLNLLEVARKALHLLEPELRRRSITPEVQLKGPAFRVRAQPVALEQIIHNLMMNALQALEQVPAPERQLTVVLEAGDRFGQLSLRDTGPGISNDALPHVFEPFFSQRDGGLGLGLSLSESLASGMGGTLLAFNQSPRGAEFCLRLPLASLQ